jgi:hypothetical protein
MFRYSDVVDVVADVLEPELINKFGERVRYKIVYRPLKAAR